MCKCTPSVRTPFCGRPGCEWPGRKPEGAREPLAPPTSGEVPDGVMFNRETGKFEARSTTLAIFDTREGAEAFMRGQQPTPPATDLVARLREAAGLLVWMEGRDGPDSDWSLHDCLDAQEACREAADLLAALATPSPAPLGADEGLIVDAVGQIIEADENGNPRLREGIGVAVLTMILTDLSKSQPTPLLADEDLISEALEVSVETYRFIGGDSANPAVGVPLEALIGKLRARLARQEP